MTLRLPAMSRRKFMALAGSLPLASADWHFAEAAPAGLTTVAPGSRGPLTLNLCGPTYYAGFNPFLNWWKTGTELTIARKSGATISGKAIWDAGGYLDRNNGELVNPVPSDLLSISRVFFATPADYQVASGCDYSGERWIAEWDGNASGTIDFLTAGGQQSKDGPNKIRFNMGANPGNTQLKLTVLDPRNPPRNIKVYQARYEKNVAAGEKFNPDWISEIKKFDCLRFMDWQCTNNSEIVDFSQLAEEGYSWWCKPLTSSSAYGPKGSVHPALICSLANLTGCSIHVCIPVKASDQFVSEFASFLKNNTKSQVLFEFSNECWHFGFQQGAYCLAQGGKLWPNDAASYLKWYGYRAAQVMKIVRDVYQDDTRWRGTLNTQTVSASPLKQMLLGVEQFRKSAGTLAVNQLFKSVCVTGYFGDVQLSKPISSISNSNPAVVYSPKHGYQNGDRVRIFIQAGMTQLNNVVATVRNVTDGSYELEGVNSLSYPKFAAGNNYAVKALIFDIMDKSLAKFRSDPATFTDKYSYFNAQLAQSLLTGTCSEGFTTDANVAKLSSTYWPALKAIAAGNGLELRQYEGGCSFVGDAYLTGWGGQPQFTDYLLHFGHSADVAKVYAASYSGFAAVGGVHPSKFTEGGPTSRYGTWAGIRFWPTAGNGNKTDLNNPVWVEVAKANAVSTAAAVR